MHSAALFHGFPLRESTHSRTAVEAQHPGNIPDYTNISGIHINFRFFMKVSYAHFALQVLLVMKDWECFSHRPIWITRMYQWANCFIYIYIYLIFWTKSRQVSLQQLRLGSARCQQNRENSWKVTWWGNWTCGTKSIDLIRNPFNRHQTFSISWQSNTFAQISNTSTLSNLRFLRQDAAANMILTDKSYWINHPCILPG